MNIPNSITKPSQSLIASFLSAFYLLILFGFLSHFHLDDESYLDIIVIQSLHAKNKLWPATEWMYGPLWPYLGYFYTKIFNLDVLNLRYLVVCLVTISGVGIYRTGKFFASDIFAFLGVILTFRYIRFPTPQLSWYVVLSIFVWVVFFIFKYIHTSSSGNLIYAGIFMGFAFICKPYPMIAYISSLICLFLLIDNLIFQKISGHNT